jgi:flagellar basal body-associated protein FliL
VVKEKFMAENEEKKADGKKGDEKGNDNPTKSDMKNKLVLIAGIAGVLLVALGVGGFFIMKTLGGNKNHDDVGQEQHDPHHNAGNKDEKKDDKKNNEPKKDEAKKDEPKKDEHKKDEHKKDEPKKDEPKKDDPNKKAEPAKNDPNSKPEEPKGTANFGDTFSLPKIDLNLGNAIENRFIRIAIAIEYRGGENQGFELKKREAQIKDIVITSVTSKTRLILISENGKENLRREILNRINEVTDRPIQNVYFTEFFVE